MAKDKDNGLFNFPSSDSRGRMDSYEEGGKVEANEYEKGGKIKARRKKTKPIEEDARKAGHGRYASEEIAKTTVDVMEGKKTPMGNRKKDITDIIKEVEGQLKANPLKKKKKSDKKKKK